MGKIGILTVALILLISINFTACGGSKKEVKSEHSTVTTTLGQELQDLNKAYKDGIITEKEYEKAKKRLIEQRTQ